MEIPPISDCRHSQQRPTSPGDPYCDRLLPVSAGFRRLDERFQAQRAMKSAAKLIEQRRLQAERLSRQLGDGKVNPWGEDSFSVFSLAFDDGCH